jgi:hypothetical protein
MNAGTMGKRESEFVEFSCTWAVGQHERIQARLCGDIECRVYMRPDGMEQAGKLRA